MPRPGADFIAGLKRLFCSIMTRSGGVKVRLFHNAAARAASDGRMHARKWLGRTWVPVFATVAIARLRKDAAGIRRQS
ncbi:MAG: hypothetical protein U1E63_12625 [Burkholderiales bacterium]